MKRIIRFRFWKDKECQGTLELKKSGIIDMDWEWDEVDQFTGVLDTQGKEIYEGDIVRWEDDKKQMWDVRWNNKLSQFTIGGSDMCFDNDYLRGNIRVIGNIYENSDLLRR